MLDIVLVFKRKDMKNGSKYFGDIDWFCLGDV